MSTIRELFGSDEEDEDSEEKILNIFTYTVEVEGEPIEIPLILANAIQHLRAERDDLKEKVAELENELCWNCGATSKDRESSADFLAAPRIGWGGR